MTVVYLAPGPFGAGGQFFDANGKVLNAGTIETDAAGSSTLTATYTTSAGSVQNANPITLGTDGRPPNEIWLTAGTAYKFILKDSLGNTIGTYDNLSGIGDPALNQQTFYVTGVAGTNTITGNLTSPPTALAAGQRFLLIPAATNTGAVTFNPQSLGAKSVFANGAACSGGELVINVPTLLAYDGTQFDIIGPMIGTRITNSLGGNVALNNTATYFDGPSVAQGTVGTWFASGTVTIQQNGNATSDFLLKLWDGTTVIASTRLIPNIAGGPSYWPVSLSGYISSPAGNLRISVRDQGLTTNNLIANASGNSKDCTISAVRIG